MVTFKLIPLDITIHIDKQITLPLDDSHSDYWTLYVRIDDIHVLHQYNSIRTEYALQVVKVVSWFVLSLTIDYCPPYSTNQFIPVIKYVLLLIDVG